MVAAEAAVPNSSSIDKEHDKTSKRFIMSSFLSNYVKCILEPLSAGQFQPTVGVVVVTLNAKCNFFAIGLGYTSYDMTNKGRAFKSVVFNCCPLPSHFPATPIGSPTPKL